MALLIGVGTIAPMIAPAWAQLNDLTAGPNYLAAKLGIGTTAPGATLEVYGTATSSFSEVASVIDPSASGDPFIFVGDSSDHGLTLGHTNNSGAASYGWISYYLLNPTIGQGLIIYNNGNVGIGTTGPVAKLDVTSADNGTEDIVQEYANNLTVGVGTYYNGIHEIGSLGYSSLYIDSQGSGSLLLQGNGGTGHVGIGTNNPGTAGLAIMIGQVGIGTTYPTDNFDLASANQIANMRIIRNEHSTYNDNTLYLGYGQASGGYINFYGQGTTAQMVIQGTTGNVGIGQTSPSYLLHVGSSSASGTVAEFQNSSGNCTFTPTTSTWSCSSDARLKKDIVDAGDALAWLGGMRIRDFTLKATGERKTGVVAQELLPHHPDMVHEGKDGFYTVDEPNPWKLVKAIQELKADNDNLRAMIERDDQEIARLRKESHTR